MRSQTAKQTAKYSRILQRRRWQRRARRPPLVHRGASYPSSLRPSGGVDYGGVEANIGVYRRRRFHRAKSSRDKKYGREAPERLGTLTEKNGLALELVFVRLFLQKH